MDIIMVYVTHKDMNNAQKVTDHLFNERLIACASYHTVQSQYVRKWWIEKSDEVVSVYKTKVQNWEKVKEAVKRIHPYTIPCILKVPVEANHAYAYRMIENVA